MTETLTSPLFPVDFVPLTWGFWDCCRLATNTEMATAGNACAVCAKLLTAKVGAGFVSGTMVGRRDWPTDDFDWEGPYCTGCNKDIGIRDGVRG